MCFLHDSTKFGNILNALSAILCLIAVLLEIVLFYFIKDLALYGEENDTVGVTVYRPIELQNMSNDNDQVDGEGNCGHFCIQIDMKQKLLISTQFYSGSNRSSTSAGAATVTRPFGYNVWHSLDTRVTTNQSKWSVTTSACPVTSTRIINIEKWCACEIDCDKETCTKSHRRITFTTSTCESNESNRNE